jgi:hypothetical protein
MTEKKALIDVSEPVNKFQGETSHLGAEGTRAKSKRHKLLKKLCLRQVLVSVALQRYLLCIIFSFSLYLYVIEGQGEHVPL